MRSGVTRAGCRSCRTPGCMLSIPYWALRWRWRRGCLLPLFLWMLPVTLGLVCAIPLAVLMGSVAVGQAFRRAHLLLIPEETAPPPVLQAALTYMVQMAGRPVQDAVMALRARAGLLKVHEIMLPPPRRPGDPINPALLVGLLKLREAPIWPPPCGN